MNVRKSEGADAQVRQIPEVKKCYGVLPSLLRKFDRYARQDRFTGQTKEEFTDWARQMRRLLFTLLGLDKMEDSPLTPVYEDTVILPDGIRREHLRIQTEPGVWMPMYILIPDQADENTELFICPPGHNGAGKYTVAGFSEYAEVAEKIRSYHYDYGYQLAKAGYVTVCPDCRGFGERRELLSDAGDLQTAMKGDCYWLAHMGEPLGIPVAGMLVWDLMRLLDYLEERGEWRYNKVMVLGFSGGGMQALFLAALDERIRTAVISGYLYGYRDSLLELNRNCSCNYIPHLWEHLDMGDIASLIAPRPLIVQSCREDRLNGRRGIANACEQVEIVRNAYLLYGKETRFLHEICEGGHQWHGERLEENLKRIQRDRENLHG